MNFLYGIRHLHQNGIIHRFVVHVCVHVCLFYVCVYVCVEKKMNEIVNMAMNFLNEICYGIRHLHQNGIIHRFVFMFVLCIHVCLF